MPNMIISTIGTPLLLPLSVVLNVESFLLLTIMLPTVVVAAYCPKWHFLLLVPLALNLAIIITASVAKYYH